MAQRARAAARALARLPTEAKNAALAAVAAALEDEQAGIHAANADDVARARRDGLSESVLDRLTLTPARLAGIAAGIAAVIALPDPIGQVEDMRRLPNGLEVGRRRVPLGVIAAIFEARPNVALDIAVLGLKAGNAVILRGGSEALASTAAITSVMRRAVARTGVPEDVVQHVLDPARERIGELLRLKGEIDVVIPRGGPGLIAYVTEHARVPVIETGWGVCHTYVDDGADLAMAERIVVNAKTRRPSICNAIDTLLVHRAIAAEFLPRLGRALAEPPVEVHAAARERALLGPGVRTAPLGPEDFDTEWLSLRMSVALVDDVDAAIAHIRAHGSGHSEAIVTESQARARRFLDEVDAAAVYVNASTQFTDGGEFGLGAEVGISTQKLHARGPMGLREMTTYKWIIVGSGQVRPL
ncbi:MAG: glutamate-5-semialdehyde dehydrogenase [Actinobacteria bacterium]|nr:glutamate-5-semialdehyde dehydrogenase [Actinomycetota bacterium]